MGAVVVDGVGADRRGRIGVGKNRVGQRRVAVGDLQPDAMAALEHICGWQHLDVEAVDFSRREGLRIGVGVERTQLGRTALVLLAVRGLQPALGDIGGHRLRALGARGLIERRLVGKLDDEAGVDLVR